jgi:hypothetical protein
MDARKVPDMVFCLIYVSKEKEKYINMRCGGIETYAYCGFYLMRSLELIGLELTILTNDKDDLIRKCSFLARAKILQLEFGLDVPADVAFRSAHHKIEIIKWIGETYVDGRFLFVDVDVVCVNKRLPDFLAQLASQSEGCILDISDQVFGHYGRERVQKDLRLLSGGQLATWFGGEFLFGTPYFFRGLAAELSAIWPQYVAQRNVLHHQGDEAVVSAALCRMLERDEKILRLQPGHVIVRWWNSNTNHRQVGLLSALRAGLLHLPSDKNFIMLCAKLKVCPRFFTTLYFIYSIFLMPAHLFRGGLNSLRQRKATKSPSLL